MNSKIPISFDPAQHAAWYVVHTKPRQEHVAEYHLTNQKFEVFLPRISVQKRKKHTLIDHIEPYFPRYLFVRFSEHADDWGPIRSTRGVAGLIRFNGRPRAVSEQLISALKSNQDSEGLQAVTPIPWLPGDEIEIEEGPFAGYRCLFQSERGADRVTVLLDLIGKLTRTTLHKQDLRIPQFA